MTEKTKNDFGIIIELRRGVLWGTIPYEKDTPAAREELNKKGRAYSNRRKATKEAQEMMRL